jgi:O-antigen/teichoic acid export membrane protein
MGGMAQLGTRRLGYIKNLPQPIWNGIKNGIAKKVGVQWLAVAYGAGVSLGLLLFLTRRLGPSGLAIYLYVSAIASLFAILQDGGFQVLVIREKASPTRELGMLPEALISGYFGYVFTATVLGIAIVLACPITYKAVFVLALLYFGLRCLTNIVSSVLKGQGDFVSEAYWKMMVHTCLAVPVFLLVGLSTATPAKVFGGLIVGQLFLLACPTARLNLVRPKWLLPPWRIWKTCLAFVIINAATTLYFKSDIVLLKHMLNDLEQIGRYGAAFQLLEGVILLATPIVHLCFVSLRTSWEDWRVLRRKLIAMLLWSSLVSAVIALAGHCFALKAIVLAYGESYAPAASLLPILLTALLFLLPNYILAQGLIAMNDEKYFAVAAVACGVFNLGLNVVLIPHFQAAGAAWATVATEILLCLLLSARVIRRWRCQVDKNMNAG